MTTLKSNKMLVAAISVLLMAISSLVYADDVTDSINEALDAYKEGEYSAAVDSLNYASQLINQKKGDSLSALLPEPLDGWSAKSSKSKAMGAAMFGGGITATRQYIKEKNNITIEIVADSPVLQSMMMMFSNPMYATSDGGKLEKISRIDFKVEELGLGFIMDENLKQRVRVIPDANIFSGKTTRESTTPAITERVRARLSTLSNKASLSSCKSLL